MPTHTGSMPRASRVTLPGPPPVVLEHVSRSFGNVVAVEDISLMAAPGALLGIIGPSGSGKTTTIRLLLGALKPDRGTIQVLGEDPRHFSRRTRERIGYMPQSFVLYPDLTARENVNLMAALFGIGALRRGRRVAEVLELVDLTDARDRRASDMSGGMQRRLELACAMVHQPQLLVLDEPTAGIDPLLRTRIWHELDHQRREGATILVTTQYVTEAEYCDAVALIAGGRLIAHATPTDLRRMALGGEVIEVGTSAPFDVRSLAPIEGVVNVRQMGPTQLLVIAQDAGVASPRIAAGVSAAGGHVDYSREYRPTFDEVFAALVTSEAEARARSEGTVE
ncbi:MAG TPA: ABC transporter ATP-binding protein [Candidatus Limnocylindria bacterium]|nr:ABC transporter ATP-binding protein [Candidatus Limnocylindria bacterium]